MLTVFDFVMGGTWRVVEPQCDIGDDVDNASDLDGVLWMGVRGCRRFLRGRIDE